MEKVFSGSIVLFKNERTSLTKAINSFLEAREDSLLFLVDNSPNDELKDLIETDRIIYIPNHTNPGFGAAHNIAIEKAQQLGINFHFIVNPDIYIIGNVIAPMLNYISSHQDVGMMMPQVLNTDGTIQYLPKLLPNILWVFRRKLKKIDLNHKKFIDKYELRSVPKDKIFNSPLLSGCFTLLNLKAIEEVGGYDDRFFMYFEDFDLSRRMHQKYKTIYFPEVSVYHGYGGGANKNVKLFKIFISSAITYFNKWGWLFDRERKQINKKTLEQF